MTSGPKDRKKPETVTVKGIKIPIARAKREHIKEQIKDAEKWAAMSSAELMAMRKEQEQARRKKEADAKRASIREIGRSSGAGYSGNKNYNL